MKRNKLNRIKPSTINIVFDFVGVYDSYFLGKLCKQISILYEKYISFKKSLGHIQEKYDDLQLYTENKVENRECIQKEATYFLEFLTKQLAIKKEDLVIDINNITSFKGRDKTPIFTKEICDQLLNNYNIVTEKKRKEDDIILNFAYITYIIEFSYIFKKIRKEILVPFTLTRKYDPESKFFSEIKEKVSFLKHHDIHNIILNKMTDFILFLDNYEGIKVKDFIGNETLSLLYKSIIYNKNLKYLIINNSNREINLINILSLLNMKDNLIDSRIQYLDIGYNYLGVNSALSLSNFLANNETIRYLYVNSNYFDDESIKLLSKSLKVNKTLKLLDLSNNRISSLGIKFLSEALMINTNIEFLYLSSNPIDYQSIKYFSYSLKYNNTLKLLYLCSCQLDDITGMFIYKILTRNRGLKYLDLSGNYLGNKSLAFIFKGISVNNSLEYINLEKNNFDDSTFIVDNLKFMSEKKNIKSINLKANYFKFSKLNCDFTKLTNITLI